VINHNYRGISHLSPKYKFYPTSSCQRNEESKRKWLIKGRRENEEQEYHHKSKEAH
jgi:hypothetical protein